MPELSRLRLFKLGTGDISVLAEMHNLHKLTIARSPVTDLSPLADNRGEGRGDDDRWAEIELYELETSDLSPMLGKLGWWPCSTWILGAEFFENPATQATVKAACETTEWGVLKIIGTPPEPPERLEREDAELLCNFPTEEPSHRCDIWGE
jgi:hypothetical protein